MNFCPCCSEQLLRHVRHNSVYWFCTHCWQEMPALPLIVKTRRERLQTLESFMGTLAAR
ncbi:MAG: hypothetical protein VKJ46_01650 [Leptolyngbyaceae bacterium]|nr:hypothetical protein [Leptolyngbyaceae bacterium]